MRKPKLDPRKITLADLVAMAASMGCDVQVELVPREPKPKRAKP